jgi:hypothetical protein
VFMEFQKRSNRAYLESLAAENKLPFECSFDEYEQAVKADDDGAHLFQILVRSYRRYSD